MYDDDVAVAEGAHVVLDALGSMVCAVTGTHQANAKTAVKSVAFLIEASQTTFLSLNFGFLSAQFCAAVLGSARWMELVGSLDPVLWNVNHKGRQRVCI